VFRIPTLRKESASRHLAEQNSYCHGRISGEPLDPANFAYELKKKEASDIDSYRAFAGRRRHNSVVSLSVAWVPKSTRDAFFRPIAVRQGMEDFSIPWE
jgi:hypothetical protein